MIDDLGDSRSAMLRVVGAVYRRFARGDHRHLCAFVVQFDNRPYGGDCTPLRPLRAEWLA